MLLAAFDAMQKLFQSRNVFAPEAIQNLIDDGFDCEQVLDGSITEGR